VNGGFAVPLHRRAGRVGVAGADRRHDRLVLALRLGDAVGQRLEECRAPPGLPQPFPEVADELPDGLGCRRLDRFVKAAVGAGVGPPVAGLHRLLALRQDPFDALDRGRRVARGRLAHGQHLHPHAHADDLQDGLARDLGDCRTAVALECHQAIALEHPQGVAHRHHTEPQVLGERPQQQPRAGSDLVLEDPAAQLVVGVLALGDVPGNQLGADRRHPGGLSRSSVAAVGAHPRTMLRPCSRRNCAT
jgi:hypothetical protein